MEGPVEAGFRQQEAKPAAPQDCKEQDGGMGRSPASLPEFARGLVWLPGYKGSIRTRTQHAAEARLL